MRVFFYLLVSQIFRVLGQNVSDTVGLNCCREIRVASTSYARDHQPASMGNYYSLPGKLNNRLVYKHYTGRISTIKLKGAGLCSLVNSCYLFIYIFQFLTWLIPEDVYVYYWTWGIELVS